MVKRGLRIKSMTSPEPPPKMSGWELLSLTGLNIFWDRDTEPHCPLMQLCSYFDYQPALSLSPLKAFDVSTSAFSLLATPNLITVWGTFCQKLFCMFSCFNLKWNFKKCTMCKEPKNRDLSCHALCYISKDKAVSGMTKAINICPHGHFCCCNVLSFSFYRFVTLSLREAEW